VENIVENSGAVDVQLTEEELKELRSAVNSADVAGDRYRPGTGALFANTPPL